MMTRTNSIVIFEQKRCDEQVNRTFISFMPTIYYSLWETKRYVLMCKVQQADFAAR